MLGLVTEVRFDTSSVSPDRWDRNTGPPTRTVAQTRPLILTTSCPHLPQVSTDAPKAAALPVVESKAPAPAQTPFRTTHKPRPYHQPKSAQDSLDFDKIILNNQLPPRPPTASKKRNVSLTVFGALATCKSR